MIHSPRIRERPKRNRPCLRFTPDGAGTKIDFSVAFEFKSRLLNAVAGAAFGKVTRQMTDAFIARARALSEKPVQQA